MGDSEVSEKEALVDAAVHCEAEVVALSLRFHREAAAAALPLGNTARRSCSPEERAGAVLQDSGQIAGQLQAMKTVELLLDAAPVSNGRCEQLKAASDGTGLGKEKYLALYLTLTIQRTGQQSMAEGDRVAQPGVGNVGVGEEAVGG